ncbi:MAG: hypothetical protein KDB27_01625 [Planctomycetales bacterium]|nr:hypothetical protein [Planctomycetales bacterium]
MILNPVQAGIETHRGSTDVLRCFVDTHAHFHPCFDATEFLNAAIKNAARLAHAPPCLLLADSPCFDSIDAIYEGLKHDDAPFGIVEETPDCARIESLGRPKGYLIRGRQIRTKERLEVLAYGGDYDISNGLPLDETLEVVSETAKLVILPWGFGKWWWPRKHLIKRIIERQAAFGNKYAALAMGESGCRPDAFGEPSDFSDSVKLKRLPGSDPLPMKSEVHRVASVGTSVELEIDRGLDESVEDQILVVVSRDHSETLGEHLTVPEFIRQQISLRIPWLRR